MKLFVDSADVQEIRAALRAGISGVTTNPTLLAKTGVPPMDALRAIVAEIEWRDVPLSVELLATTYAEQCTEARWLNAELQYAHLVFKVPIAWDGLQIVREIQTNVTAVMSYGQALMAANAGARYVSVFWGRISDTGADAAMTVRQIRETFERSQCRTEIIVGSIRQPRDVTEALQAGAHIVTVPLPILRQLCVHPKTDEVVAQFLLDAHQNEEKSS